jgi:twitching motility two-component system response regulator PilG
VLNLMQWKQALENPRVQEATVHQAIERLKKSDSDPFLRACQVALAFLNLRDAGAALAHLNEAAGIQPQNRMIATLVSLLANLPLASDRPALKILVVDDSATHTLFVVQNLAPLGYEVMTAACGAEGIEKAPAADFLFLDITMPGMDGYEVCNKIREDPRTAKIPIVLLSGKDGFFDKVRGRMVGATDYLTKPCAPEQLVEMVRRFCPKA